MNACVLPVSDMLTGSACDIQKQERDFYEQRETLDCGKRRCNGF